MTIITYGVLCNICRFICIPSTLYESYFNNGRYLQVQIQSHIDDFHTWGGASVDLTQNEARRQSAVRPARCL